MWHIHEPYSGDMENIGFGEDIIDKINKKRSFFRSLYYSSCI
jgi:hypothetical protein